MQNLITIDDIRAIRQITSNIDEASVNPYIPEAQNIDLRNLLGIKFFNVLRKELATTPTPPTRATDILNGKLYTVDAVEIEFLGIKPLLAYYAYARAIAVLGTRIARHGVVKKVTNFSEPAEKAEIDALVISAKSIAKVHEEDLLYFLNKNKTTYPEFFTTGEVGQIHPAIRITAVGNNDKSYE